MIKTIYILWFQGFDNAPELIQKCIHSWKFYNPDWNIILIDDTNLHHYIHLDTYIHNIHDKHIEKCHLADIIRTILLKIYGGLWVDATTFCNKPLNDWLPHFISQGFFAFERPGPDKLLSNWFLYSDPHNFIISEWCTSTVNYYILNDKAHNYSIHHYLFGDLYNSNHTFKSIWDTVPKLSANDFGPHYLQQKGMFNTLTSQIKHDIDNKITPLYKLTYKCNFPQYDPSLNLFYLYSTLNYT
jgi:hypothetical protein